MRSYFITPFLLLLTTVGFAQNPARRAKTSVYSAASAWQKVTLQPAAHSAEPAPVVRVPDKQTEPVQQPVLPARGQDESVTQTNPTDNPAPAAKPTEPADRPPTPTNPVARPNHVPSSAVADGGFRPAFTGDFATNRNGWKAGSKGDYYYQIGLGRYSIRKRNANTHQTAFSYVALPPDIDLNGADFFTIKVDMLADSGQVPAGGVLFGVRDSLNYCAFRMNHQGEVSIVRVVNGKTASDYMPGDFFGPGVPVERNRNRLTIRRRNNALHFYVNEREVRSSPYLFRVLPGNGIGLTSSAYWTTFQKLSVTLGP